MLDANRDTMSIGQCISYMEYSITYEV